MTEPTHNAAGNPIVYGRPLSEMTKPTTLEPGIYPDMPFADYLALPYESNSHLKPMAISPLHYIEQEPVDTAATQFGTAAHVVILEAETMLKRLVVMPDYRAKVTAEYEAAGKSCVKPGGTKRYKQLVADFHDGLACRPGVQVIEQEKLDALTSMQTRIRENEIAAKWLAFPHQTEVTIIWDDPDTGIRCKGRLDIWLHEHNLIVDYKTTSWLAGFEKEIVRWGYNRQAAMYVDGMQAILHEGTAFDTAVAFGIIAQESQPPYAVQAAPLDADSIKAGRRAYKRDLARVAACRASGVWPGPDNPDCWRIPEWAMPDAGGKVIWDGVETEHETKPGEFPPGESEF